jgi:Flp pilus assembly protein TadG
VTWRARHGQAAAEFALVIPFLALLVMGAVDFARVFYSYQAIINAAREGARYCALNPGNAAGTRTRVQGELAGKVPLTAAQIAAITCPSAQPDQELTVRVSATFQPITPLIDRFFKDPGTGALKPITAAATVSTTGPSTL